MRGGKVDSVYRYQMRVVGKMSIVVNVDGYGLVVIDVVDNGERIASGDEIMWEGDIAMWTPQYRLDEGILDDDVGAKPPRMQILYRVGNSYPFGQLVDRLRWLGLWEHDK